MTTNPHTPATPATPAATPAPLLAARALLEREVGGASSSGVWSSPGRANLIGEHTDYNEGFVLPFAIDFRTYVAATTTTAPALRVASAFSGSAVDVPLQALRTDDPASFRAAGYPDWALYAVGVAWAGLREASVDPGSVPGVVLADASQVPGGAGLSSSAAIEGAVGLALNDLWGLGLSRVQLAQVGQRAENQVVDAPTGIMDQMASLLGQADCATFLDCRTLESEEVPLGFAAAGLEIAVINTRVKHAHATGGYGARRASCERGAAALGVSALRDVTEADLPRAAALLDDETYRRVRHVVTEDQRVLDTVAALRAGDMAPVGTLLDASHVSMRDDFEISVPELDSAVETARAAGALGARMTGGGFGGCAIALVPTGDVGRLSEAVLAEFAARGFAEPEVFVTGAAQGGRREA